MNNGIQKLVPSLQGTLGANPVVGKNPIGVRSAAFHKENPSGLELVTRMRSPSNAAPDENPRPLPVRICNTAPEKARTTTSEGPVPGTQMFVPSKTGWWGLLPTVTDCRIAPPLSSLRSLLAVESVIQMLAPSKSMPSGKVRPVVTVVAVQGIVGPGVTIETPPVLFAVQRRSPSKARATGKFPRVLETVVTAPPASVGSS